MNTLYVGLFEFDIIDISCSFSRRFYDTLSVVSLGSLVIFMVGGLAIGLGVANSGGLDAASWGQVGHV